MAPSATRPETAGARKDAPAGADETSFAEVLDAEVQATDEAGTTSDAAATATTQTVTPAQAQPAPPPANVIDLLLSLQSADTPAVQAEAHVAGATPTTAVTPAVAAVTPGIPAKQSAATTPAPADSIFAAPTSETGPQIVQPVVPQTTVETADPAQPAAASIAAAAVPAAPKDPLAADPDNESSVDSSVTTSTDDSSPEAKAVGGDTPAALPTPAENSSAPAVNTPVQAVIVAAPMMPKPAAPNAVVEEKTAPKVQPAETQEASADDAQSASSRAGSPAASGTSNPQASASATKAQTGAQTIAADAAPDAKANGPSPAPNGGSTSFADTLAAARGAADAPKVAPAHQALQSAPPAVVQVYTRFVERFDGRAQRFEVSLTPEELGRVDVRIEVGADKKVHAVLAAHDSAALTDLMRGQRALERALTDAGIDLKDGGLKFELANDSGRSLAGQEQRRDAWSGEDANVWRGFSNVDVAVETDTPIATASYRRASRLDLVA